MKEERHNPNPKGREGKPISVPPMSFDEAVKKMLSTQPPKSEDKEPKTPKRKA